MEIKEILLDLIPQAGQKIRAQVNEVMDLELYKQQIENDTFDLKSVSQFVVSIMLSLCAPARDSTVRAVLDNTNPVHILRAIFSALDLIRLDFVNYQLRTLRPTLLANSVQYEQGKFRSLLEKNPHGLDKTKSWLSATVSEMKGRNDAVTPATVLEAAFWRLIEEEVGFYVIFKNI